MGALDDRIAALKAKRDALNTEIDLLTSLTDILTKVDSSPVGKVVMLRIKDKSSSVWTPALLLKISDTTWVTTYRQGTFTSQQVISFLSNSDVDKVAALGVVVPNEYFG